MRLGFALVVLVSCFLASACSFEMPHRLDRFINQGGKPSGETTAHHQARVRNYSVGEAADFGSYSLTINGLYKTDGSGYGGDYKSALEPGEVYVVLDASFESASNSVRRVFFHQGAEMYDAGGYTIPTGSLPEIGGGPQGTLLPGRKISGEEVYVAKKDSDLTLVYNPSNKEGGITPVTFDLGSVSDIPEKNTVAAPEKTSGPADGSSSEPTQASGGELTVGDTTVTERGNEIAVLSYESPLPASDTFQPEPGYEYSAIEVRGCASPNLRGTANLDPAAFSLQMRDDTFIETDVNVKEPALSRISLKAGDCAHGWVTFQTPQGEVPKYVLFAPSFTPIMWRVRTVEAPSTSSAGVSSDTGIASIGEEKAVEDAVRGHYTAIGDGNFDEAYSYFGPTFRSQQSRESWIAGEESYDIKSSSINALDVTYISDTKATATVDVSFEDNTGTPRFLITWNLVKEGGEWKLDDQVSAEKAH